MKNIFIGRLILAAIIPFILGTFSCSGDDGNIPATPEIPTEISEEIKDLIYFKGDEMAPTVLINAQGGPDIVLSEDIVHKILIDFNTTGILTLNVHQAQTLNPDILMGNDITLEQAVDFNAESVETLYKVVKYFKDQGRTVYVLGISFGAFIAQELIAKKGIDVADNYLIMSGRLDMNEVIWQAAAEGIFGYFVNGVTPVLGEPEEIPLERNAARITAGLGMNRYTQRLNTIDDLSNVTYIYGTTDQFVGSLTAEEVQFLKSRNVNILTGSGDHDEPFVGFFEQGFKEAFGIE